VCVCVCVCVGIGYRQTSGRTQAFINTASCNRKSYGPTVY